MKTSRAALLAMLFIHTVPALAGLGAPTGVSSSFVLPEGVSNPRFITVFGAYTEDRDDQGNLEPVGHDLNKTIRWKDVILVQKTDDDKNGLRAILQALHLTELDTPGRSTGEVNVAAVGFVPSFAYGVTDRFTLAFALPIIQINVNATTGYVGNSSGQTALNAICSASTPVRCNEIRSQFANAVDQMTAYYKYDPVHSEHTTKIGDARIIGKYLLWWRGDQSIGLSGDLSLPTGTGPNPDKIIDVATSDGQWGIGATFAYDAKRLLGDLSFGAYAGYTFRPADRIVKRIPEDGQLLPRDKEEVSRNLGDRIATGAGFTYDFQKSGITLGTGYHFQYITQTTYQGLLYPDARYRQLDSKDPLQAMHSMSASVGVSTVGMYRKKTFSVPMEANLNFGKILEARNVADADRVTAEVVLFF